MICAIIVAGGSGLRMNNTIRKQYLKLDGVPILAKTLSVFLAIPSIGQILAVVPEEDLKFCKTTILPQIPVKSNSKISIQFIAGGKERQDSVFNGIMALPESTSVVVVHDGVRPLIRKDKISDCIDAAKIYKAVMLGIPVGDTLKQVDQNSDVIKTLERQQFWYAQTPQVFDYYLLRKAHEEARKEGFRGTDDAMLVERLGGTVKMIEGDKFNIKITTPEDLELAEYILSRR